MGYGSIFSRASRWLRGKLGKTGALDKNLTYTNTVKQWINGAEYTSVVTNAARAGSKTILTWGNAVKGAIVAGGGVIAYHWFGSGIPAFFADTFGVSEDQGSWIAIACFLLLFAAVLTYIFRRVSYSEHRSFRTPKRVNKSYNIGGRRR